MHKNRAGLTAIILAGFLLRLAWLDGQSLWYDEAVTWMLSQMRSPGDLVRWTAADIQPPLYYLLLWLTTISWGTSEWALRFPSALAGTLTIPLMAVLARRLWPRRPAAARLAAGLFAVSPLMVYYGQEARMYTLLVLEASLAGWLLLKILHAPDLPRPGLYAAYALTAAASLYTHYFAAFLLLAHGLYAAGVLWRQGRPRARTLRLLAAFIAAGLLFVPWTPTLLARLGDDPSYWPGALKLHEAVRKLLITFSLGETVLEQTGLRLLPPFLLLLALGGLDASRRKSGRGTRFILLWLVLPPALILTLSYRSPKFNPRYAMLAWPAFCLLLTAALTGLAAPARRRRLRQVKPALFVLALVYLLGTGFYSLAGWYTDPRFSKDDFRALARFVQERMAPDETVLLSSGHMFPVWAYYFGWENWTPLPRMEKLDVTRVTTLDIAADIAQATAGKQGVWLVSWQDEVIDPNGVVPFWLDLIGQRPNDAGDFWGVRLEHWRLDPDKTGRLHQNPIHRPAQVNFANRVELLGMTQLADDDLALFWRPRQPLPDDLLLTLGLTDPDGFNWDREDFVGRPGAYTYPPSRWPVGQVIMTRHRLNWQIGTPPGLYLAEVGLGQVDPQTGEFRGWDVLDEQGRPQRRVALLEHVNLSRLVQPESGPLPPDPDPVVDFYPLVAVRRVILPQATAEPGDRLLLALLWQAGPYNTDDISVAFDLIDSAGQTFRVGHSLTPSRSFNLPRWRPGDMVLGQYWLNIPGQAASGPARLQLRLVHTGGAFPYDEAFPLAQVRILPTDRNFTPPDKVDMPLAADFSGLLTLIGADCANNCRAAPGGTLALTLYWRGKAPIDQNYTVFTHLLGPDETVLVNADHAPPKPTRGWASGEIITDPVALTLPAGLPPGQYRLEVGLYNAAAADYPRLPLTGGETRVILPQPVQIK